MNPFLLDILWVDVTEFMSLNDVTEYCESQHVSPVISAGHVYLPIFAEELCSSF